METDWDKKAAFNKHKLEAKVTLNLSADEYKRYNGVWVRGDELNGVPTSFVESHPEWNNPKYFFWREGVAKEEHAWMPFHMMAELLGYQAEQN